MRPLPSSNGWIVTNQRWQAPRAGQRRFCLVPRGSWPSQRAVAGPAGVPRNAHAPVHRGRRQPASAPQSHRARRRRRSWLCRCVRLGRARHANRTLGPRLTAWRGSGSRQASFRLPLRHSGRSGKARRFRSRAAGQLTTVPRPRRASRLPCCSI